ncbi:MAG: hypothetical protein OET81_12710, partial [Desulfobacteraceae bacterium]|nr:hypothetical protein [Desulfobacteraceae bacterium]
IKELFAPPSKPVLGITFAVLLINNMSSMRFVAGFPFYILLKKLTAVSLSPHDTPPPSLLEL